MPGTRGRQAVTLTLYYCTALHPALSCIVSTELVLCRYYAWPSTCFAQGGINWFLMFLRSYPRALAPGIFFLGLPHIHLSSLLTMGSDSIVIIFLTTMPCISPIILFMDVPFLISHKQIFHSVLPIYLFAHCRSK